MRLDSFADSIFPVTQIGLGTDIWEVTPAHITAILKVNLPLVLIRWKLLANLCQYFFVDEFLYIALISTVKISILLLFLRIFPSTVSTWFRWACFAWIGISVAYWVSMTLAIVFACQPMHYHWHRWNPSKYEGSCVNTNTAMFSGAAINIAMDIGILALPLPKLWKLELGKWKKIGVFATFSVGSFSIICSIIRLKYLVNWDKTRNPTYDYNIVALWSSIEGTSAIICACMPQSAGPIKRAYNKSIGKITSMGSKRYEISESAGSHAVELSRHKTNETREDSVQKGKEPSVHTMYDERAASSHSQEELVGKDSWPGSLGAVRGDKRHLDV